MFVVLCMLGVQECVHAQGLGVDVHGLADGLKALVEVGLTKAAGLLLYPTSPLGTVAACSQHLWVNCVPRTAHCRLLCSPLQPPVTPCAIAMLRNDI